MRACVILIALLTLSAPLRAQDFPFGSFERTSLAAITAQWNEGTNDSLKEKRRSGSEIFIAKIQRVVVQAIYRGPHRPIDAATARFMQDFAKTIQATQGFAGLYEEEYLFVEDDREYWLPVQKSVAAYFEKEIKPGQSINLYAVAAGGVLEDSGWKWVLPVEEFNSSPR